MPALCSFDTQSETTVKFPRSFVDFPRLPHGFRHLDMSKDQHSSVKSTIPFFTNDWANCRYIPIDGADFYRGIDDVFALAPGDIDFLTGEHLRYIWNNPDNSPESVRIDFERPFVTPPKVVVFFNRLEFDKKTNRRIITTASDIDAKGFTLNIKTWSDTNLYAAQTCWIAYPEDREHIFSTTVSTMDIRPWNEPQLQHSAEISFKSIEFLKKPSVFIALNYIDMDCKANFYVNAYVDGVSTTRLVWHIDSWGDTVLYAAGATIIAFI